jgi:release factor glutamine methyltransferase
MNVSEALSQARAILGIQLEAEILLAFVMEKKREFLMSHTEAKISPPALRRFQSLSRKRSHGVPIAYLTGHKEFYGLDFFIEPGVFIPRPETELLVEVTIERVRDTGYGVRILDVGTGSGCIAIALAKYITHAQITAIDISRKALKLAKKNSLLHGVSDRITFLQSDLLENVMVSEIVVANLPYIGENENHFVSKEVLDHEPPDALFGGETGLELYEKLFAQIRALPRLPRWLIGEIGFLQQEAIERCIRQYFGNISLKFQNDLSGLPRLFSISFNKSATRRSAGCMKN